MLLIYTGNGKGKTSASVGQAIRALGQGLTVYFGQFMKRPEQAGEQKILATLLNERFLACGAGFFRKEEERPTHREAALHLLQWATAHLDTADMIILDETLYALGSGLLTQQEITTLLDAAERAGTHVVLSGRGLPDWLRERADLVTEMMEIKHPYNLGERAGKGIEY
ncbi:cob(I)yrinic acid a,c-diamide adenosyltransferase [Desulfovibrio cuneatus]|uniref:cob(I)yrinic acid a,c-diamide adenosyltransferase n=1 Tax=Desulfovibrio cuneatus TaxID=159728 RepID=UPI00041BDCFB|nr:cob(I)yrinic acid a,c-diamide adenosyltransferase [Desulfovibrio cuneatus]